VKINDANVTATDVAASNGVIHVIDTVLVPASVDVASLLAAPAADTTVPAAADTTVAAAAAAAADTTVPAAADTTVPAAAAPAAPENLTVYFGNASAALNAEANAKIEGAIATLKALPAGTKVSIVGHASPTGNAAKNQALSIARANNVKAALIAGLGADAEKITFNVEARGDTQPDVDAAKSRKVTIEIQP
jgi:OmpA-OmpF porin, OOP family